MPSRRRQRLPDPLFVCLGLEPGSITSTDVKHDSYNGAVRADYSGKRTVESMKKWVEKTVASFVFSLATRTATDRENRSSIRTLTSDRDVQEKVEREEVVLFYLVEEGSQTDQVLFCARYPWRRLLTT